MNGFDVLESLVKPVAQGSVAVSLASHDDGSLSVVAWLLPAGRRVGYARWSRPAPAPPVALAPEVAASGLGETIQVIARSVVERAAACPLAGRCPVAAGVA
jgi:hypothetical protein